MQIQCSLRSVVRITHSPESDSSKSVVSNHPVHLVDRHNNISPSALIPFCAFATDLEVLGEYMEGLTFPVCTQFQPTVISGELCYQLDVNPFIGRDRQSYHGKKSGLMLVIDTNKDRWIVTDHQEAQERLAGSPGKFLDLDNVPDDLSNLARIEIGTLARYQGYGSGSYVMTDLKAGIFICPSGSVYRCGCILRNLKNKVAPFPKQLKKLSKLSEEFSRGNLDQGSPEKSGIQELYITPTFL